MRDLMINMDTRVWIAVEPDSDLEMMPCVGVDSFYIDARGHGEIELRLILHTQLFTARHIDTVQVLNGKSCNNPKEYDESRLVVEACNCRWLATHLDRISAVNPDDAARVEAIATFEFDRGRLCAS